MIKKFFNNKMLGFALVLLVLFLPAAISNPQQSRTDAIVTAIAVDKKDDEFEVSLQYMVPYLSSYTDSLKVVSSKGKSVAEAVDNLSKNFAKIAGFAHCKILVFNDEACKENFTSILDFFLRRRTNTNDVVLINTPDKAKDILSTAKNLENDLYININNSKLIAGENDFQELKNIGEYYDSFFSKTKCIAINIFEIDEQSQSGSSGGEGSSSNDSTKSSSSSGESEQQKQLKNEGKLLIIKDEKGLVSLDKEQSYNLSLFNQKIKNFYYELKNVSDDNLKNANIIFEVYEKKNKTKVFFKDGVPHFDFSTKIYVRTSQIIDEDLSQSDYQVQQKKYDKKVFDKMKEDLTNRLKSAEAHFKSYKYDVVNCFDKFNKFKNKEFNDYLSKLSDDKYFLEDIVFDYHVEIVERL